MCGIAGVLGGGGTETVEKMIAAEVHRGPDAEGTWTSPAGRCALGHRRLSILDLSPAGRQPMPSADGRYQIVFNGEIYNYLELREELGGRAAFRTGTDTEVLLAAYERWGANCLHRLIGMFSFILWDEGEQTAFAARDRFGVKPLYFCRPDKQTVWLASEIKALHAAGFPREPASEIWSTYLSSGMYDHGPETFWRGVRQVGPGNYVLWRPGEEPIERSWYDAAESALAAGPDERGDGCVADELLTLLEDSVRLRFRSDVPVGICLSGGLDSSLLFGLVRKIQGRDSEVKAFTFCTGDPRYDETPWVRQLLEGTRHPSFVCPLVADEVPKLAAEVGWYQDEPFGGLPTLGMAKVHQRAADEGVVVLLDGNGMDEAWAGYDYYARAGSVATSDGPVQGSGCAATQSDCLTPEFAGLARRFSPAAPFGDALRDLQYRDLRNAKIPRAMRFADRVSMMYSRELREPFLDHRIVELGLRQPAARKIQGGQGKWLPRQIAAVLLPDGVREAPKRPVQTPQREWLRGPLRDWTEDCIGDMLRVCPGWFDAEAVGRAWSRYQQGHSDNSFFVWQWVSASSLRR